MTLADFIAPKPTNGNIQPLAHCFHLDTSIRILLAILEGVEYMHAQGVVHRDLKPANVFLKVEETPRANPTCVDLSSCTDCQAQKKAEPINLGVCIGDFGLVTNTTQASQVHSSAAVGTEIYRPTASKDNISPQLDIFAVGIIACELLCKFGTQMERRQTLQDLRTGQFPKQLDSCARQRGHASRLRECIASMLSEETSIAEVKQSLESMLAKETATSRIGGRDEALRRSST
jgi:translation initiation factor 2-alpha kinase 3